MFIQFSIGIVESNRLITTNSHYRVKLRRQTKNLCNLNLSLESIRNTRIKTKHFTSPSTDFIIQIHYYYCTTIDSDDSGSRMSQYNNRKKKIKMIKWIWIFHRSVMDL